jgi:hypothetical protein
MCTPRPVMPGFLTPTNSSSGSQPDDMDVHHLPSCNHLFDGYATEMEAERRSLGRSRMVWVCLDTWTGQTTVIHHGATTLMSVGRLDSHRWVWSEVHTCRCLEKLPPRLQSNVPRHGLTEDTKKKTKKRNCTTRGHSSRCRVVLYDEVD